MLRSALRRFASSPHALPNLIAAGVALVVVRAVLVPSVYVVAVAVCRAIFPWFTWHEEYWEIAVSTQVWAVWLPMPVLFAALFLVTRTLLRRLVKRWRLTGKRGRPARVGYALGGVALLPSLAALAAVLIIPAMAFGPGYYTTGGKRLQRDSCSHCHSPYRPFHFFRPPEQWQTTVNRMRELEGAPVDEAQGERIAGYLSSRLSYTDAWMFRARCLRCHDRSQLEATPRSQEEWERIIDRAALTSPYAFRPDWKAQLVQHTADTLADETSADPTKVLFESRCGRCHELSLTTAQTSRGTLDRMAGKVPGSISGAEIEAIEAFLAGLPDDEEAWSTQFPHDQPMEVEW